MQPLPPEVPNPISLTPDQATQTTFARPAKLSFKKYLNKRNLIIFGAIFLVTCGLLFFLLPRAQTVRFTSSTRESLSNSFTQLDLVNTSLKTLFRFATQSEDDVKLTKSTDIFINNQLLLSNTKTQGQNFDNRLGNRLENLIKDLSDLFEKLEITDSKVAFGEKIKGFTTPADDPRKLYRDQRDLAEDTKAAVENSEKALKDLDDQVGRKSIHSLSSLKEELTNLKASATDYLSEAEKTADYYILISDLSIELEGSFDSFQISLGAVDNVNSLVASFDEVSKELKSLRQELALVEKGNLPAEIDDLHNDSIEIFDVVIKYFDEMKVLTLKEDQAKIVDTTQKTSVKLNQLIVKGADHEISFWKNNKILNSYDLLSENHTQTLKKLEKAHDDNNFFFLNILGIK